MIRMMRKATLAVALVCSMAAFADNSMVVNLKDGTTNTFVLAEKPRVTFDETMMTVATADVQAQYKLSDVENFLFDDVEPSGIKTTERNDLKFSYQDGIVRVEGAEGAVRLLDIAGKAVDSKVGSAVEFNMNGKAAGTYIVSMKGRNIKIQVR